MEKNIEVSVLWNHDADVGELTQRTIEIKVDGPGVELGGNITVYHPINALLSSAYLNAEMALREVMELVYAAISKKIEEGE